MRELIESRERVLDEMKIDKGSEKVELIFSSKEKANDLKKKLLARKDINIKGKPSVKKTKAFTTYSLFVTFNSFADRVAFFKANLYVAEKPHYKDIHSDYGTR